MQVATEETEETLLPARPREVPEVRRQVTLLQQEALRTWAVSSGTPNRALSPLQRRQLPLLVQEVREVQVGMQAPVVMVQ